MDGSADGDENAKIFPQRLMEILTEPDNTDAITWLPHGRAFIIVNRQKFANTILPKYFRKTKYTSFTRKLNRWNFTRITRGPELGAYYHEFFQRGNEALCTQMYCKNTRSRFADSHKQNGNDTSCAAATNNQNSNNSNNDSNNNQNNGLMVPPPAGMMAVPPSLVSMKPAPNMSCMVQQQQDNNININGCTPLLPPLTATAAKYAEPVKSTGDDIDLKGDSKNMMFSKPTMPSVNPAVQTRRMLTNETAPSLNPHYDPVTQNILGTTLQALQSGLLSQQDYVNNVFATQATSPEAYWVLQHQLAALQQYHQQQQRSNGTQQQPFYAQQQHPQPHVQQQQDSAKRHDFRASAA